MTDDQKIKEDLAALASNIIEDPEKNVVVFLI